MDSPVTIDEYSDWQLRRSARQAITRRSALKAVMAGAGGVASAQFGLAGAAFAAGGGRAGRSGVVVSGRHLSFVPGADGVPRHAMAVTAQVVVSKTGRLPRGLRVFVDVGTEPGRYGTRFDAPVQHLVGGYAIPGGPVGSQFYAKAKLHGLSPATRYHYRFRLSDGTVSGDAHFTTAPDSGHGYHLLAPAKPFTFTAFADVGTNAAPTDPRHAWNEEPAVVTDAGGTWPAGIFDGNTYDSTDPVAGARGGDPYPALTQTRLMDTQRPAFTLLAGDICYANPTGSGLPADDSEAMSRRAPKGTNLFNPYVWDVFLNQIEPQAAFTPWMFTTGNHDMEPLYGNTEFLGGSPSHGYGGHLARLDLPGNGRHTCPSVYRFRYANVGVISIDANDLSAEVKTNTGYSGGAQLAWIERTLREWRTVGSVAADIDFIVAFFHHCAFSTTNNHASDGGVRGALEPLFSRYQVDLAIFKATTI